MSPETSHDPLDLNLLATVDLPVSLPAGESQGFGQFLKVVYVESFFPELPRGEHLSIGVHMTHGSWPGSRSRSVR